MPLTTPRKFLYSEEGDKVSALSQESPEPSPGEHDRGVIIGMLRQCEEPGHPITDRGSTLTNPGRAAADLITENICLSFTADWTVIAVTRSRDNYTGAVLGDGVKDTDRMRAVGGFKRNRSSYIFFYSIKGRGRFY